MNADTGQRAVRRAEAPDDRRSQAATGGIVASGVCKSFGTHLVLDEVSLTAEAGGILALLGRRYL